VATDLKDFRRGDTFLLRFNWGTGKNITGWTMTFSLRDTFTSALVTSVKRTAGDYPLDEVLNGIFYYFYDSASSQALVPKKYKYDLQLVIPGTHKQVHTLLPKDENYDEPLIILPDVTWIDV
jgi:hypothetical protein